MCCNVQYITVYQSVFEVVYIYNNFNPIKASKISILYF